MSVDLTRFHQGFFDELEQRDGQRPRGVNSRCRFVRASCRRVQSPDMQLTDAATAAMSA
jgi:hypothetical protein